jgi:hypothetical protein
MSEPRSFDPDRYPDPHSELERIQSDISGKDAFADPEVTSAKSRGIILEAVLIAAALAAVLLYAVLW